MIRAVVFDFDGIVLDTELPGYRAIAEIWERHGARLDAAEWSTNIGAHGGFDAYSALADRALDRESVPSATELEAAHEARALELLHAERALPGVVEWLEAAPDLGLSVAIASSASGRWVESHLERLGLRHHFAVVTTWRHPVAPKPAPDLYLEACRSLGVEPAEAIAVEDSPPGVAAAVAAGLWCIAVPNEMTRPLDLSAADHLLPSLADLPLADAVALAERRHAR